MSNILSQFTENNFEAPSNPDVVGGGFSPVETDIYDVIIQNAYLTKSQGGAFGVVLNVMIVNDGVKKHRETIYISNREGQNYYINKTTGQKSPLPGFLTVNELCNVVSGKPLSEQETQDMYVNIYDFELGKEIPKEVPVFVGLTDAKVKAAIQKIKSNKQEKTDDGYIPTSEERETNQIAKFLEAESGKTWFEIQQGKDSTYAKAWLEQWQGKVLDKTTYRGSSRTGVPQNNQNKEKVVTKSLFA